MSDAYGPEHTPDPGPPGTARLRLARALAAPAVARTAAGEPHPGRADPGPDPPATAPAGMLARLGGRAFDPGRPGLRALAAVAAVVVLGAAVLAWWTRPRPEPVPPPVAATRPAAEPAGAPAASPTPPAELVVAVSGKVREPGLVRLPPGSRVADAIEAAGGVLPDADVDHLNLARRVADGELIAVGVPPPPGAPPAGAPGATPAGTKVNLNTATLAELETLPGIGPTMAQRIIDYRTEQGSFTSVGELRQVSGIGEVRFADLKDLVMV